MSYYRPDQVHTIESLEAQGISMIAEDGVPTLKSVSAKFSLAGATHWLQGDFSKSVFLRVLSGLQRPTEGGVFLGKKDIYDLTFEEFLPLRLNIGYSFAFGGILSNRTLRDNLLLPFQYHGVPAEVAKDLVDEVVHAFGMERHENKRPASVPGIFRKITSIARALVADPQVLMLDDPTSGLGEEKVRVLRKWLKDRSEKKGTSATLLVASDDKTFLEGLSAKIWVFKDADISVRPEDGYSRAESA